MVNDVKKLKDGTYLINGNVIVRNLKFLEGEGNIDYDLEFEEEFIKESEAIEIAEEFILNAVEAFLKENREKKD